MTRAEGYFRSFKGETLTPDGQLCAVVDVSHERRTDRIVVHRSDGKAAGQEELRSAFQKVPVVLARLMRAS